MCGNISLRINKNTDMANLNQFIDPDLTASDVTHSSAYGQAAGGGGLGGLSMEARRQKLGQTRVVGAYSQSKLGSSRGTAKAKAVDGTGSSVYDPSSGTFVSTPSSAGDAAAGDTLEAGNRQQGGIKDSSQIDSSMARRQSFNEPKARNYNPYS
jgi:hypothetical protein